jgi:enoyl-CoA hydratase
MPGSESPASPESPIPPDLVKADLSAGVLRLTLDSPANRNALSRQLVGELGAQLTTAATDAQVRVVVLTHAGSTFCSGADLSALAGGDTTDAADRVAAASTGMRDLLNLLTAIVELPKPVLAVVNGPARAGGIGLIGACDVAIAGPQASFAFTEVRLGLAPAVISLVTRHRLQPRAAQRYLLTGDVFDAVEAARIGLITETGPDVDELLERYLTSLRAGSGQGLARSKALTTADVRATLAEHGGPMVALSAQLFASAEAQEGLAARRERRSPAWLTP